MGFVVYSSEGSCSAAGVILGFNPWLLLIMELTVIINFYHFTDIRDFLVAWLNPIA